MTWLYSGSIVQQVGRVFNLFAILVLVIGGCALLGTYRIEQRSDNLSTLTSVAFKAANMNRQVSLAKDNMGSYTVLGTDPNTINVAIQHLQNARAVNADLKVAVEGSDPELVERVNGVDSALAGIETVLNEVRDAPREEVATDEFMSSRYYAMDLGIQEIVALSDDAAVRVEEASGKGMGEINLLLAVLLVLVAGAFALVLFGKRMVAHRFVNPIAEISDTSEAIAQGDTSSEIPGLSRQDEIGSLARSLGVLRAVQQEASDQAKRDLERERELQREREEERERQREQYRAQLQALAEQFEQTVGDVATEVATASGQMHAAAIELSKHVEASSASFSEANTNLKQASVGITSAAAASDEFALSISEVSRQASSSSDSARKAAQAVGNADQTVAALTGSAEKISQIIEVIAGIAHRTNLLALNASIEAARGGEAGRGFAVVASEVKELAIQTGRATQEVETLIRHMQESTHESAEALGLVSKEVIALEQTALAIASAVDQQAVSGQELAKSIEVAAHNTRSVSATVDGIDQVSLVSGATAAEVQMSSANLSSQASLLREQVSKFLAEVRAA